MHSFKAIAKASSDHRQIKILLSSNRRAKVQRNFNESDFNNTIAINWREFAEIHFKLKSRIRIAFEQMNAQCKFHGGMVLTLKCITWVALEMRMSKCDVENCLGKTTNHFVWGSHMGDVGGWWGGQSAETWIANESTLTEWHFQKIMICQPPVAPWIFHWLVAQSQWGESTAVYRPRIDGAIKITNFQIVHINPKHVTEMLSNESSECRAKARFNISGFFPNAITFKGQKVICLARFYASIKKFTQKCEW